MKSLILAISFSLLMGCASTPQEGIDKASNSAVFRYSYDQVWRALQISLQNYPIKVNNSEKGIIETETLRDGTAWTHPTNEARSSQRYSIRAKALKGAIRSKPAIKVLVTKKVKKYKNFVEGSIESTGSDHLEEATLLYRVKRELIIDHALSKLQQKE